MTRVLIVHSSDELYGADRVLLTMARHLDRARFDLRVVVPDDLPYRGELTVALTAAGVPVRSLGLAVLRRRYLRPLGLLRYASRLAASTWALRRLIRAERIDVVHSFTTAVLPGALAARLTRTPHVWSAHELVMRPAALRRLLAWLLPRLSCRVVAVSETMRQHLAATERRNAAATVIPNAVDAARFAVSPEVVAAVRRELGAGPDDLLVGTVGRLRPGKGQHVLVDAAARLADVAAVYAVVGDALAGEEAFDRALREQAAAVGLADRFTFTGFRTDVPAILAALDVFVSPSIHPESFGLGILEAMAAGTAVVATTGAGAELVVDGFTGILVDPDDPDALAEALDDLAAHPERRAALARAGRERAVAGFGPVSFAAAWTEVYAAAAGARS